ncbi:MAG TPA: dienelactone hydrolase family protein [Chryseosolibacter sp.]
MRNVLLLLLAVVSLTAWNCKDEEIVPTPAATELKKDSTAATSKTESESDSLKNISDSTALPGGSSLDFADSAYYQHAKYSSMPYRVMVPAKFDKNKKYPLVVFLHGIDERGFDNEKQLRWGASLFQADSTRAKHPSFVIFPQCPPDYRWPDEFPMETLKNLITDFASTNNVDRRRIYLVGMSMGAYGTYEMVARNPDMFAAAIAISGDGDLTRSNRMAKVQWKIYAGKKDDIVTSDKSEKMAHALKSSGASVSLKIYPDANHVGSWVKAFAEPDFCSWLYSVSK